MYCFTQNYLKVLNLQTYNLILCNVQCTMHNVQCTMHNVQCKLWTIAPLTFSKRRRRKEVEYEKQSLEKKCNI